LPDEISEDFGENFEDILISLTILLAKPYLINGLIVFKA